MKIFGYLPIFKIMLTMTVSYFILIVSAKTESRRLKTFGKLLAITFWIITVYMTAMSYYLHCSGLDSLNLDKFQKRHCSRAHIE